jgi:hypothetical protein
MDSGVLEWFFHVYSVPPEGRAGQNYDHHQERFARRFFHPLAPPVAGDGLSLE